MSLTITLLLSLLSIVFLWSGIRKLTGGMTNRFLTWGYPEWLIWGLGIAELLAIPFLWMDSTRFIAVLFLLILTVILVITLMNNGELIHRYMPPITVLGLLCTLIYFLYY